MNLRKPERTVYRTDRGGSEKTIAFYDGNKERVDWYVRGGICWPFSEHSGESVAIRAYAVLLGQDVATGKVYVLEHTPFRSIEPILDEDTGFVKHPGLAMWFNKQWTQWFASRYYWHETNLSNASYRRAVLKSQTTQPKPSFDEAKWQDDNVIDSTVLTMIGSKTLIYPVSFGEELAKNTEKGVLNAARHALWCAIVGMDRTPYRKARERPAEVFKI